MQTDTAYNESGNQAPGVGITCAPRDLSADRTFRLFLRGAAWTTAFRWASQLSTWAVTIYVMRLLTPADYGLVGLATVFTGLIQLVSDLGLSAAIVQRRNLDSGQVARLAGLSVALGVLWLSVSLLFAQPLGLFYKDSRLPIVVAVFGLTFLFTSFRVVPTALLTKDMRFRTLAGIGLAESVVGAASTLALALVGAGYWALVGGAISASFAGTVITLRFRRHPISWPSNLDSTGDAVTFGSQVLVARVGWYLYSNADFAVIGRVLGPSQLGLYTVGWELSSRPVERLTGGITQVLFPVLAAVRKNRKELATYLIRLTEALSLTVFPLTAGLAMTAPELVRILLGERWMAAVWPFAILSLFGGLRHVNGILLQVLVASGESRTAMRINLIGALVMPLLFFAGTSWGIAGVACAWAIGHITIIAVPSIRSGCRVAGTEVREYIGALLPAVRATVLMCAAVGLARASTGSVSSPVRLGVCVAVGIAVYFGALLLFSRERLAAALGFVRHPNV